jgi:uncharacterized protein (DUF2235 family)
VLLVERFCHSDAEKLGIQHWERNEDAATTGWISSLSLFIDGTWLWAGSDSNLDVFSNVYFLNTLLNPDDADGHAQIVHYTRGLGAVASGTARKLWQGAFASGIDDIIADLYVNICANYERGDKIYIFGFSRGAVIARALTGLLSFGILKADHIYNFTQVWKAYLKLGGIVLSDGARQRSTIDELKAGDPTTFDYSKYCEERDPKIEFVGVFDTVSGGHGAAEFAQRLRLNAGEVQPNVKHAVQLLAIDESRDFFKPVLWTGLKERTRKTFEQIWMPGVHSDVGGAYKTRHLGNLALLTMIDRVIARTSLGFNLRQCRKLLHLHPIGGEVIRIHDEFVDPRWRAISSAVSREVDPNFPQAIHPFAKQMLNMPVNFKAEGHHRPYALSPGFRAMKDAKEFLSGKFKSNC